MFLLITTVFTKKRVIKLVDKVGESGKETSNTLKSFGFKMPDVHSLFEGYPVEVSNKTFSLQRQ